MSSATLIYGVPFNKLFKREKEKITRYNEKTGVPYEAESSYWTLCGKRIEPKEDPRYYPEESLGNISCVSNGIEGDTDHICGVTINKCSDCNSGSDNIVSVDPDAIEKAKKKAKEVLEGIGYEGEIGLYLVMHESF